MASVSRLARHPTVAAMASTDAHDAAISPGRRPTTWNGTAERGRSTGVTDRAQIRALAASALR